MTVSDARQGAKMRIVGVDGGRRLVNRLAGLGFVPGAVILVLRPRGPGLVSINGTRIAIGRDAAAAIAVEAAGP